MPKDEFFKKRESNEEYKFSVEASAEMQNANLQETRRAERVLGAEGYDANVLQMENDQIMSHMQNEGLLSEISDDMRDRLIAKDQTRLTRNNAILLFDDKRMKDDSTLMKNVKRSIRELDEELRKPMEAGPDVVYEKYETAIGFLSAYEREKDPKFADGKRRKEKVIRLKEQFTAELSRFREQMARFEDPAAIPEELKIPMSILEGKHLGPEGAGENAEKLDERKLEFLSMKYGQGEDDEELLNVKNSFREISALITGDLGEEADIRQHAASIEGAYSQFIERCKGYLDNLTPKTSKQKRNYKAIENVMKRCVYEFDYIKTTALAMKRENPEGQLTWKDVYGQVTIMAEECMDARMKTEVILGDHPPIRKMLGLFGSMDTMYPQSYKYKMLSGSIIPDWLEDHFDKKMADDLITERFLIMEELASKYNAVVGAPVPKEYLKNPEDDPMDEKIRKAYARLVVTSDPAFATYNALNSVVTTVCNGLNNEKSLFAGENEAAGVYFLHRGIERKAAMSKKDKRAINRNAEIVGRLESTDYRELNEEAVAHYTESVNKDTRIRSRKNLNALLIRNKDLKREMAEEPEEELQNIQNTMNVVRGKAFIPVERPETRTGTWTKIKNRLMLGYRWMVGASIGTVATLALNSYYGVKKLLYEDKEVKQAQEKRTHNAVPGREGEFFEDEEVAKNEKGEDLEVYSDVRRGPLVWEKLSAGDPEDPPEVIIMTRQAERGSSAAIGGGGYEHACLGLSYSRYNKLTNRKERYQLTMGFFPGGGIRTKTGLAGVGGAVIAGRLADESGFKYDVARRYQVKPGDINKILRAAETYADKGYQCYKRNCTTFVVDMAKTIKLPVAEDLKEEELKLDGTQEALAETAFSSYKAGYYMGADAISSRMNKMDLSYQNFGQKMFTKEELKRYYDTAGSTGVIKKGYSPGAVGETLRNEDRGELSAAYAEHDKLKINEIGDAIEASGRALWTEIEKILPKDLNMPTDQQMHRSLIAANDEGLNILDKLTSTPKDVRKVYKKIRTDMRKLNEYYRERLGGDSRINEAFMKHISLLETALTLTDRMYQDVIYKDASGDAGALRYNYGKTSYKISFRDANGKGVRTTMSMGIFEGYLMAGKTPEQVIKDHRRLGMLGRNKNRTAKEEAEFQKLNKWRRLAADFASANRYLLDKEEYSDKDINYAFSELPAMETNIKQDESIGGEFSQGKRPSIAYQGVILEKVFGGIKELKLDTAPSDEEALKGLDEYAEERLN
ncbi:MAG: hypothetical protein J6N76_05990, partial [Lachnospiraceae bacterium]|nr:hypothetical protein [Lachnospiraceae bacterium]